MQNIFITLRVELLTVVLSWYILDKIRKLRKQSENFNKFYYYSVAMAAFTFINMLSSAADEQIAFTNKPCGFIINLFYMILLCGGSFNWFQYAENVLESDWIKTRKKRIVCYIPIAVFIILCITSWKTGLIFSVDQTGLYHRGPLWILEFIFCYIFMAIAVVKVFIYVVIKKEDYGKHKKALMANSIVALFGCILQIIYAHSYVAIGATIGMVISYVELCTTEEQEILEQRATEHLLEEVQRQKEELQKALDDYKQADYDRRTDFLTGLHNRQDMYELLQDSLSGKRGRITSIFMLDIDNFKRLNDRYGHSYGDECLKKVAEALRNYGQSHEMLFYRYGGEEILGMSFGEAEKAKGIAEELVLLIEELGLERDDTEIGVVTVSLGYTTDNRDYISMIDMADEAMYVAKAKGKNRACCYETM